MIRTKFKICTGGCQKSRKIWKNHGGKKYCEECWMKKTEELTKSSSEAKPIKSSKRYIPAMSSKRAKEQAEYKQRRKIFISNNPICKMKVPGHCTINATDVQHLKGRTGDLFLNEEFWMAACRTCHTYADTHPAEAVKNGWALLRLTNQQNDKMKKEQDVKDRVYSIETAIEELTQKDQEVVIYLLMKKAGITGHALAYQELVIGCKALNGGYVDEDEINYIPWFNRTKKPGAGFYDSRSTWTHDRDVDVSFRLQLKNRDLAIHCGQKFENQWYTYIKTK